MSDYEKYVLAVRRAGAEDMRERAAKLADKHREKWQYGDGGDTFMAGAAKNIAEAIRALPIDEGGETNG